MEKRGRDPLVSGIHIECFLDHLISRCDGLGICVIGSLVDDKLGQTRFHPHVGHLELLIENVGTEDVVAIGIFEEEGFAAVGALFEERTAYAFKTLVVLEVKEPYLGDTALTTVCEGGYDLGILVDVVSYKLSTLQTVGLT